MHPTDSGHWEHVGNHIEHIRDTKIQSLARHTKFSIALLWFLGTLLARHTKFSKVFYWILGTHFGVVCSYCAINKISNPLANIPTSSFVGILKGGNGGVDD
jgi:hypothetical protein